MGESYRLRASAPPGWEDRVERLKDNPAIDNPFALAWWMTERGYGQQAGASAAFVAAALTVLASCQCTETCTCPFTYDGDPYADDEADGTAPELLSFADDAVDGRIFFAAEQAHPNCWPFKAVVHQVDRPSDRPPGGADGHLVMISRAVAERRAQTMVHMGINMQTDLGGHQVTNKIGVVKAAAVGRDPDPNTVVNGFIPDPNALMVSGCLYARDFPDEIAALRRAAATGQLGTSYEVARAKIRDPRARVWVLDDLVYTGAAALWRDDAAYKDTQLAAQRDDTKEPTMPDPTPSPAPAAPTPDPMDERLKAALAPILAGFEALRSECSSRFQAIEGAVAALSTKPGEAPDEMALRQQAQTMDEQAAALDPQVLAKREEVTALRAAGKEAEATAAATAAEALVQQAGTLRAEAITLRAKAYGYTPFIQAMRGLVTDGLATMEKKLATDLGAKIDAIGAKLITDAGGPGGGPGAGGPVQPERISLSAGAMRLLGKFDGALEKGVSELELDAAMQAGGLNVQQQIGLKAEIAQRGLLRG